MLGDIDLRKVDHPRGKVTKLTTVAEAFGTSYATVRGTWKRGGMPVEKNGSYDLEKVFFWKVHRPSDPDRVRLLRTAAGTQQSDDGFIDLVEAKRKEEWRLKRGQADKVDRENLLAEGDIVHRRDVERFVSGMLVHVRDTFSELPNELKASFPTNARSQLAELLKGAVDIRLRMLHRYVGEATEIHKNV